MCISNWWDMEGQVWSIISKVDKVSNVEQIHESAFLGSEQECHILQCIR